MKNGFEGKAHDSGVQNVLRKGVVHVIRNDSPHRAQATRTIRRMMRAKGLRANLKRT